MHKSLHPRDDIDKQYVLRKERRRGLASNKDSVEHRYNDSKTTDKSMEEDWLQPPETILTTGRPAEQQ